MGELSERKREFHRSYNKRWRRRDREEKMREILISIEEKKVG